MSRRTVDSFKELYAHFGESAGTMTVERSRFRSRRNPASCEELYATLVNSWEPRSLRCRILYLGGLLLALRSFMPPW